MAVLGYNMYSSMNCCVATQFLCFKMPYKEIQVRNAANKPTNFSFYFLYFDKTEVGDPRNVTWRMQI